MEICARTYERLLAQVEKPGRYLGNELGCGAQGPGSRRPALRPRLPRGLRDRPVPSRPAAALRSAEPADGRLRRARLRAVVRPRGACCASTDHPLVSLETYTPLREFHIVGFSLQYELTYTNILTMLDLGGIPLRAAGPAGRPSAGDRGRPVRLQPRAAGRLPRRRPARRRRGSDRRHLRRLPALGPARSRRAARGAGAGVGRLRAGVLHAALRRQRAAGVDRPDPSPSCRVSSRSASCATSTRVPLHRNPRRAEHQGRARPPEPRGDARLRQGLPLLPGRLHLPAAARARSAARARPGRARRRGHRHRRAVAAQPQHRRLLAASTRC